MNRGIKFLLLTVMLLTTVTFAFGETADDYFARGYEKQQKGDLDGAIVDYTRAIELKPDYADVYGNRGVAKQAKGDLDGAIADYNKVVELKPDVVAYYNRAYAKQAKGDWNGAIADYTKTVELKPDYAGAYNNRGNTKKSKGDLDGAIADYNQAIDLHENSGNAYYNRGNLKKDKGDLDGAIADYTEAIKLKPDDVDSYNHRGYLRYALHNFRDALADFRKAAELNSADNYVPLQVWLIRTQLGETEAATKELKTYLASRTTDKPDDWLPKIGRFLAGELAELEFLAAAKNPDPKTEVGQLCEAYFYAGSKRLLAGDKTTATDYFRKAVATNKQDYTEYTRAIAELKFLKAAK